MARVLATHIAQAVHVVGAMSLHEKEQLTSEICKAQPNLLASVIVLSKFGTTNEDLDVLLNILFLCHGAVCAANLQLPMVSEEIQEICLARVVGRAKFIEDLSDEMRSKAIQDQIDSHREPYLLAMVVSELRACHVADAQTEATKYFLLSALNLVESITHVANAA